MKRTSIFLAILVVTASLPAQEAVELKLWPDGSPNSNGLSGEEQLLENGRVANVSEPTLAVYPAEKGNGMVVISCPGGGYRRLAMNHEGHDMAAWFNGQGITYAVLKYRMPNGNLYAPLSDVLKAIGLMRKDEYGWGTAVDKIGIMGFSAGGHLASAAATHFTSAEDRPDFQILFYPAIILNEGIGARMFGDDPRKEIILKYTSDLQVKPDTPQAIIFCSADDRSVPPEHGIRYFSALTAKGVPAALHIYPSGGHGWGYGDAFTYKRQWTGELEKWLLEIQKSSPGSMAH